MSSRSMSGEGPIDTSTGRNCKVPQMMHQEAPNDSQPLHGDIIDHYKTFWLTQGAFRHPEEAQKAYLPDGHKGLLVVDIGGLDVRGLDVWGLDVWGFGHLGFGRLGFGRLGFGRSGFSLMDVRGFGNRTFEP